LQLQYFNISKVHEIEKNLTVREAILRALKDNLVMAQNRMKQQANQGRYERHFVEGDQVFLRLQPCKQTPLKAQHCQKLAHKFYGPYIVLKRVGSVVDSMDTQIQIGSTVFLTERALLDIVSVLATLWSRGAAESSHVWHPVWLKLSSHPVFHDKSKHIKIRYCYIRDMVQRGAVRLQFMTTEDQVVDVFTKPLSKTKFEYFRDKLSVVPLQRE
jgi:hypothetical protein